MTKYFSKDTPLASLERMMMSVPGFQKRGGGMMVLCRFHYKKEDVDCAYCQSYMRHTCQASVCPYIPERLEAGTVSYQELAEGCLHMAGHQKLWNRLSSLPKGKSLPLVLEPAHRRRLSEWLEAGIATSCPHELAAAYSKHIAGKEDWEMVDIYADEGSVVQKMLCNEKYIGDALLQKTYIADLFTREKRVNNGELPKYYVHDCHPAIIDRETFQKVQEEIARRSSLKKTSSKAKTQLGKYCGKYVLSELLVCGECGSPYRRVIWTQKGAKRVVWRCQNRLEHGRKICKQSPTLDEGDIHDAVISAMNELFRMQAAKDAVKAGIAAVLAGEEQTLSLPAVEHQIRNLQERQLELFQLIVSAGADCTDYDEELQQVYMAKTKLMAQKAELEKEHRGAAAFDSRLAELDMALEQASGALTDFDELTVRQLVSNIKVLDKDSLLICFKDGTEITQTIQRRRSA